MRYYDDELYHYGHLGMKWGKHVFGDPKQRAIRKEFRKRNPLDKKELRNERSELKEAGIRKGLFSDRIAKSSTINRYSSTNKETIDGKRKYGSLTKTDARVYKNDALANGLSNKGNNVYLYELSTTKKLKVANPEKVAKDIIKRYGDKDIKSLYKENSKLHVRDHYHKLNKELGDPKNPNHWMADKVRKDNTTLNRFYHKTLYDNNKANEIYNRYKKKGYDAIGDPEDYSDAYYYPIILLDPKSSVKKKRVRKIR